MNSSAYPNFQQFKSALRSGAPDAAYLRTEGKYGVYYTPFEYISPAVRFVLVGITPGPTQKECSYVQARSLLATEASDVQILREVKRHCAFKGMRDCIDAMLDHFRIPCLFGVPSASLLWTTDFDCFLPTSVIPNAAFDNARYFSGPFTAVLKSTLLRSEFEHIFIPSIAGLAKDILYVGLGPVVDEVLKWCACRGIIRDRQIIGYFPHASGSSGSQFAYFMRQKRREDLKDKDPVRFRVRELDAVYDRIRVNVEELFRNPLVP